LGDPARVHLFRAVFWDGGRGGDGALSGHFGNFGIDDDFIKQVRSVVTEGTSGLLLLLATVTVDEVVDAFKSAPHFEIIATNLTHEREQKLKEAFA
jgi:uncharacterized membrane protein